MIGQQNSYELNYNIVDLIYHYSSQVHYISIRVYMKKKSFLDDILCRGRYIWMEHIRCTFLPGPALDRGRIGALRHYPTRHKIEASFASSGHHSGKAQWLLFFSLIFLLFFLVFKHSKYIYLKKYFYSIFKGAHRKNVTCTVKIMFKPLLENVGNIKKIMAFLKCSCLSKKTLRHFENN